MRSRATMIHRLRRVGAGVRSALCDAFWTPACPGCDGPLDVGETLCHVCRENVASLPADRCSRCSCPLSSHDTLTKRTCPDLPEFITARIILGEYEDARRCIFRFKFEGNRAAGRALANLLAEVVSQNPWGRAADIVLPVPVHRRRKRARGFNQSDLLARAVARQLGKEFRTDVLRRTKNTPPQTRMTTPAERKKNVQDAFAVSGEYDLTGRTVLLVDDIITTGATVSACARVLLDAGACTVMAAALAHPFSATQAS